MQSARGLLRTIPDDLPRTTFVSAVAVAAIFVGMAVGSYLDLAPPLTAPGIERPTSNTAPIGGNLTATTFRDIAEAQTAMVVTIWTELPRPQVTMNEFFRRGEESFGGEDFRRFFGQPGVRLGIGRASVTRTRTSRSARRWRRPAPGSSSTTTA